MMHRLLASVLFCLSSAVPAFAAEKVTIALNWVPEPEFGGIYQAQIDKTYQKNGLDVTIKPGGVGAPTWQRVASGQVEFAVSAADDVIIAQSNGGDVVAIFAIYQNSPQGIMVHADRGLKELADVFKSGTLAIEVGKPYSLFLEQKYGMGGIKRVPYTGGIANFLADKNFAQQCYIFSEPILARRQGADPRTFLIADSGYDPYGVIITRRKLLNEKPNLVLAMVKSLEAGWTQYLLDPRAANEVMQKLNPNMDPETFALGAAAQAPLIQTENGEKRAMGSMRRERWETLIQQLKSLDLIDSPPTAEACYVDLIGK